MQFEEIENNRNQIYSLGSGLAKFFDGMLIQYDI